MDDSFRKPIPFPGGEGADLPRLARIDLATADLASLVGSLSRAGQFLTLLTVFGEVLHDPQMSRGVMWTSGWPNGSAALIEGAVAHARGGRAVMFEVMAPAANATGPLKWWRVHLSPVLTEDGNAIQFLMAQTTDITGKMDQVHRQARADWLPELSLPGRGKV